MFSDTYTEVQDNYLKSTMDKTGYYKSVEGRYFYFQKGRKLKDKTGPDELFEITQPDPHAPYVKTKLQTLDVSESPMQPVAMADISKVFEVKPTREQQIEEAYKRFFMFKSVNRQIDCPLHRKLSVGEAVKVGNLKDCVVIAEHPQYPGLFAVEHTVVEHNYGRPIRIPNRIEAWYWPDIDKIVPPKPTQSVNLEVSKLMGALRVSTRTLDSLIHEFISRDLRDDANYQRGYVWTVQDKQRFIVSVLENRPSGLFVLVRDRTCRTRDYFVLDGKQRLSALVGFFTSQFPLPDGVYFHELEFVIRNMFEGALVSVAELDSSQLNPAQLCDIFLAINTGGVPQSEEHLAYVRKLRAELAAQ